MSIENIAIIGGGGQMGSGIAQVIATSGMQATIVETTDAAIALGSKRISRSLARFVRSGTLTEGESADIESRIGATTNLEQEGREADYVIETIYEDVDAKREVLRRLDTVAREEVVFASNTSQFAISKLASATSRPDRVIGTHWFNPPPVMRLIEVVRGVETSDETLQTTLELAGKLGKETIVCKKDTQGFVTSRLMLLWIVEAARIVEEGIADVEDVNKACVLAFNHPMGPLATADLGGLETSVAACEAMTQHHGDRFRAPQVMRALVNAGHYGRKTGRGFSNYGEAQ